MMIVMKVLSSGIMLIGKAGQDNVLGDTRRISFNPANPNEYALFPVRFAANGVVRNIEAAYEIHQHDLDVELLGAYKAAISGLDLPPEPKILV
jgi:hypothetical protein